MLNVTLTADKIQIGARLSVTFQRTLRLPEDDREYPLPPGLGAFPLYPSASFPQTPAEWRHRGDALIPIYQREALWLGFNGADWKPNAVQIGVGNINAVSGEMWEERLSNSPQNYLVCPQQPWLDGFNAGEDRIRQFVAVPVGSGYSVEAQLSAAPEAGGIRIVVYEPHPGRFPDEPPPVRAISFAARLATPAPPSEMGLGAGGFMRQKIYPDHHGIDTWDSDNRGSVYIHLLDSTSFRKFTGLEPPPTPVDAATYTRFGLPWFDLYDEDLPSIEAPERLRKLKSLRELEKEKDPDAPPGLEQSVNVKPGHVWKLKH